MSAFNPIGNKPWTDKQYHKEKTMAKKKTPATPTAAEPYYVNPHTKEPVDYPNIIAYCQHSRSNPYWVRSQIEQAKAINAPQTTISVSDGKAYDFFELKNMELAQEIVSRLERGVTSPPPEVPCKHCQEDTADGFHSCEGAEAEAEERAI